MHLRNLVVYRISWPVFLAHEYRVRAVVELPRGSG